MAVHTDFSKSVSEIIDNSTVREAELALPALASELSTQN
jgi:hypothetical protein